MLMKLKELKIYIYIYFYQNYLYLEDYEQRTKAFKGDVRETVYGYLSSINNSIDGKTSKLRKFFDKD